MSYFLRLIEHPDRALGLRELCRAVRLGQLNEKCFEVNPAAFEKVPGKPFAYWISDDVRNLFSRFPTFESNERVVKQGLATADDFRFLRAWWEVPSSTQSPKWVLLAKGGAYAPFYSDVFLVVNWEHGGLEIKNNLNAAGGVRSNVWMLKDTESKYFRRIGITWPLRTQKFGPRVLPIDCIFGHKGPVFFAGCNDQDKLLSSLALMMSSPFKLILSLQLNAADATARSFEVGVLQRTILPNLGADFVGRLSELARAAWRSRRRSDNAENSHAYLLPSCLRACRADCDPSATEANLLKIQEQVDAIAFDLFEFNEADRATALGAASESNDVSSGESDDDENDDGGSPSNGEVDGLLSWSVGVAFGRFDVRLATGERAIPPEPDAFDSLPAKSPGMLPDGDPPFMPTSGVFTDDPGHPDDLAARVIAVYERVKQAPPAPDDIRRTIAKDFFPAHIRMYSKSRRKAPIYWQLATPSANYSVWLYIHAFSKDTLFRVQNDYLATKLRDERHQLDRLRADAGPTPSSGQSRAIETQAAFVEELSAMLDEVRRVAPLWDPDLDDGIILNFAPLWRLVPQNRAWQKECRAAWDALAKGDYDWARLSMRLWPERVIPKCAKDRSLAIAHGLEAVFWMEGADGKWAARSVPTRPVDQLIAERTSTAVKAALASLLEAPDPVAATRRRGGAAA